MSSSERTRSFFAARVSRCGLGVAALMVATATAAAAQTVPTSSSAPPAALPLHVGGFGGMQAVQKAGGQAGVELGVHVTPRIDVFGEAAWFQNTATRRRIELASNVAGNLQTLQGRPATGDLEAPSWFFGGGARVFLVSSGSTRPYLLGEGGAARVTLQPQFTLAGTDVTTTLPTYGVTLGADLTGTSTKPAGGAGVGVEVSRGAWRIDVGFRVTVIATPDQATNVLRLTVGVARGF